MKIRTLSLLIALFFGLATAHAQQQYIFMLRYGTDNYKLLDGATTGSTEQKNTSVFHTTCIWVAEGKANVPSGNTGDSIAHVHFTGSGLYLSLQDAHTAGQVVSSQPANKLYFDKYRVHAYNSGGTYHNLAYPGGVGSLGWRYWHTTALFDDKLLLNESYTCVVCPVNMVEGFTRGPEINDGIGLDEFNTLTSSTYMRSQSALYHQYYQGTGHTSNNVHFADRPYTFYAQEGKAITENKPADYTNFTYRWDLYDGTTLLPDYDPAGTNKYVSINHATGEVTYVYPYPDSYASTGKTLTLRLTATWQGDPTKQAYDERDIVFHPLNNPTGLTANDMRLQTRETKEGDYTLAGADPVYRNVSATLASGDDDIIAINNDNYTFSVTGLRMGTVTLTITADRVNDEPLTTTITVTVIDIAANHPTGIEDRIAYLNDLEDHSWSYYTTESPEGLRSLNPADVRITYYGNGNKNMTKTGVNSDEDNPTVFSLNATGVKVGRTEDVNTFVYYKTLDRTDPATGTGRCEYTTIPNPFQVRPVGGGGSSSTVVTRTFQVGNFEGTVNDYMPFSVHTPYSLSFQIYTYDELDGYGDISEIYYYMYDDCDREETIDVYMKLVDETYFPSNSWAANYVTASDRVFSGSITFVKGWNKITLPTAFGYSDADPIPKNLLICVHDRTAVYYPLQQYDFAQYASAGNSTIYWYAGAFQGDKDPTLSGSGTTTTYKSLLGITKEVTVPADISPYRGFYKWRIASVSGGKIYDAATGGSLLAAGDKVDAEQQLFFAPDNEYGMDVKFEALWAKAYVTTSTNTSGLDAAVGRERNFMVLSSNPAPASSVTKTIGSGTATSYGASLPRTSNKYSRSIQIYTATEIDAAGTITALQFYCSTGVSDRKIGIYLMHTTLAATAPSDIDISSLTPVYSSNNCSFYSGWNTLSLSGSGFEYDGVRNLLVIVDDHTGSEGNSLFYTYNNGGTRARYWSSDTAIPGIPEGMSQTANKNNQIKFTITPYSSGNSIRNISVPCTVMACNPDGTNFKSGVNILGGIDCGADLKIENIGVTGNDQCIRGNGHNLTFGRGVRGNVGLVFGRAPSGYTNYTIRFESGTIENYYAINPNSATYSYGVTTRTIFGCDYDRARVQDAIHPDARYNDSLDVAPNPGNIVRGGGNLGFSDSGNRNNLMYDWTVKSGHINRNSTLKAVGDESLYLGNSKNLADSPDYMQYMGKRRVTVEGGVLADIAGGMNNYGSSYSTYAVNDGTYTTLIRLKGGTVRGAVYGGGAYAGSNGTIKLIFTGGEVQGWVAGACNGTHATGGEHYGTTHLYIGGKAKVKQTGDHPYDNPNDSYMGIRHVYNTTDGTGAFGGNIFGAGCGFQKKEYDTSGDPTTTVYGDPDITVGKVFGTTIVVADSAVVGRDVYGGGKFGFVADATSGSTGLTGNTDMTSRIYILGGTVHGDVMGGARNQIGQTAEIYIRGGQLVGRKINFPGDNLEYYGDVYGGCDSWGEMKGTATIEMTGGTVTNIFGGGYGLASHMKDDVTVTISGGLVKGNVYGGGECGMTSNSTTDPVTTVNIRGGKILGSVFGGALGTANTVHVKGPKYVNIGVGASDNVNHENCYIGGNVYGGSQRADDYYEYISGNPSASGQTNISSWVNVASGYIENHVFGAGFFGHTYGSTKVFIGQNAINNAPGHSTMPTGYDAPNTLIINGDVFGGADFGSFDGKHFGDPTIEGYNDVYIDGLDYDTKSQSPNDDDYMIIGGSVYGCGTSCYGSAHEHGTSVFIRNYGHDVLNPDFDPESIEHPRFLPPTRDLQSIQFSDKLIIDKTHVHLVGQGKINSLITSEKYSIFEMEDSICLVNGSTICIDYPIDQVMKLGSYSCVNTDTVYNPEPTYTKIAYNGFGDDGSATDNKIGIHNGTALYVHHNKYTVIPPTNPGDPTTYKPGYGELKGFFHLMGTNENMGTAYARPKQGKDVGNRIPNNYYENNLDGGFVSYYSNDPFDATSNYKNRFTAGTLEGTLSDTYEKAPGLADSDASAVQMAYTNHTDHMSKAGEAYFRVWKYSKGIHSFRNGTLDAHSNGETGTYSVATVDIIMPDMVSGGAYRIKVNDDESIAINYGENMIPVNAGFTKNPGTYEDIPTSGAASVTDNWMYVDGEGFQNGKAIDDSNVHGGLTDLNINPDVRFGLVMIPNGAFGENLNPVIIHPEAHTALADSTWAIDATQEGRLPVLHFLLTYSNSLKSNAVLYPVTITFEQIKVIEHGASDGVNDTTIIVDEVDVNLEIVTSTNINQRMETHAYALMKGKGSHTDTYTASVTFPVYSTQQGGELSVWKLKKSFWTPTSSDFNDSWVANDTTLYYESDDEFAMTVQTALNADNINGWDVTDNLVLDSKGFEPLDATPVEIAETYGRRPATIEFDLHYDGNEKVDDNSIMGTLSFTFELTNVKGGDAEHDYKKDVIVDVIIHRNGQGKGWYIDGVHGNNSFSGLYPNAAKRTLSAILSSLEFMPGDDIYIVNEVSTGNSALEWNGSKYSGLNIYRYPGGHKQMQEGTSATCNMDYYKTYHDTVDSPVPYTGALVKVTSNMTMHDITLDGLYYDSAIVANSPLVEIVSGSLTMEGSTLQNNYNSKGNGGGIVVNDDATLDMSDSYIKDNLVTKNYNGGGVYMMPSATLNVNNLVVVEDNKSGTDDNDVYLPSYRSWINVGESPADGMYIGVTKTEYYDDVVDMLFAYTPVVKTPYNDANNKVVHDQLVFDDQAGYSVEKIDGSHLTSSSEFYSYLTGTWYTAVTRQPDGFDASQIDTPEELAWVISLVNGRGEEDGGTPTEATAKTDIKLTADIDMGERIWVPIGTSETPYAGNFDGNGHVVTGLQSPLLRDDMGLFGVIGTVGDNSAKIENMVAEVEFRDGPMKNVGAIAGSMKGSASIINCEGAGTLKGSAGTDNIGGLVGKATGGTIQSSFAVTDITVFDDTTYVGGLVGENTSNIYNSYSNVTMSGGWQGGLVGDNRGRVENCYSTTTTNAFAHTNSSTGVIQYCYAPTTSYVGSTKTGSTLTGHGTYTATFDRKAPGYMYGDNVVTLAGEGTNTYYNKGSLYASAGGDTITYAENHKIQWNGMLYALSQWATENPVNLNPAPTPWFRPTTQAINNDLPILGFNKNVCVASLNEDSRFLEYDNSLDNLLDIYNAKDKKASVFLYKDQINVANTPDNEVSVFINENACLTQATGADDFINTTVGITFDNSCQKAKDNFGNNLYYDWHLMSSSLSNASMGIAYKNYTSQEDYNAPIDIQNMYDNYFPNFMPNELGANQDSDWNWDFFSYYEPEYHWINLKRNKNDHFHYDYGRDPDSTGVYQTDASGHQYYQIIYTGSDQGANIYESDTCRFTPGKGYMMAIQKDSYMNSTGTLNKGEVKIKITHTLQDPDWDGYFSQGCNLVGNPYQAYLDLDLVSSGNTNRIKGFYIYDADQNAYVPYVEDASENTWTPSQYIHPHQAFFVMLSRSSSNVTDTVPFTFTPSMATTTSNVQSYFRGDKVNYPLVNLFVSNEKGDKNYTIVEVGRPKLGGAERSETLETTNFDFYAHYGDNNYKLLFTPENERRVPVFFKTQEDGQYTITWDTYHGQFNVLKLIDNITGTECNMLATDHYTFEGHAKDFAARFYLVFDNPNDDDPNGNQDDDRPLAFNDGYGWIVYGSGQLQLVDVTGHVLYSQYLTGEMSRVNFDRFAAGVYVLRLGDKTQKIVVY